MGWPKEIKHFNDWLGTLNFKHKIVIAGNHDITFDSYKKAELSKRFYNDELKYDPEECKSMLTNCTYLEDSAVEVMGYKIYGSPWSPWFYDWAFNAQRGEECIELWKKIPTDTDVLLTHGPAHKILDTCSNG